MFADKIRYAVVLHGVFGNASYFLLINANSLSCSLRRAAIRLHQVVRNTLVIQTAAQSSQ